MSIESFLNPPSEYECVEAFNDKETLFPQTADEPDGKNSTESNQDVATSLSAQKEQLKVLCTAKLIFLVKLIVREAPCRPLQMCRDCFEVI